VYNLNSSAPSTTSSSYHTRPGTRAEQSSGCRRPSGKAPSSFLVSADALSEDGIAVQLGNTKTNHTILPGIATISIDTSTFTIMERSDIRYVARAWVIINITCLVQNAQESIAVNLRKQSEPGYLKDLCLNVKAPESCHVICTVGLPQCVALQVGDKWSFVACIGLRTPGFGSGTPYSFESNVNTSAKRYQQSPNDQYIDSFLLALQPSSTPLIWSAAVACVVEYKHSFFPPTTRLEHAVIVNTEAYTEAQNRQEMHGSQYGSNYTFNPKKPRRWHASFPELQGYESMAQSILRAIKTQASSKDAYVRPGDALGALNDLKECVHPLSLVHSQEAVEMVEKALQNEDSFPHPPLGDLTNRHLDQAGQI